MKKTTSHSILLFAFIVCIVSIKGFAQSVTGTLIDEKTKTTIPFANVQIGKNYGVITNQEGKFNINIRDFSENDSLTFSSLGYEKKSIAIKDFQGDKVYLQENVNELDDVLLMDRKLTAEEVMQRVNENISKNYGNPLMKFSIFHRVKNSTTPGKLKFDIKKADFIPKETLREFNDNMEQLAAKAKGTTTSFFNADLVEVAVRDEDSLKLSVKKATELINEKKDNSMSVLLGDVIEQIGKKIKSSNTFKVRTGIIPIGDSVDLSSSFMNEKKDSIDSVSTQSLRYKYSNLLKDDPFHRPEGGFEIAIGGTGSGSGVIFNHITEVDDYEYKIEDISTFNGEFIYVISFKPDSGFFGGGGKYIGKIYVSTETFAVVKTDYELDEGEHGKKFNMKFLLGIKFVENEKSGTVIFQRDEKDKYVPKYMRTSGKMYAFADRSFVFKENDENKDDRIKLKFKFTMEFDNAYTNEYLFVDPTSISSEEFDAFQENLGVPVEKTAKYNPETWKDYNIIAPTEDIEEYEY
ncbi:carboxypeptidase-like regulatory domain-containing protein [Mesonia aquimarina]|uniref:carboxypeptidase-like regulatory domain-containing protein n=1 Tax=Mesonia aquimarina TaxID=1504967 RepID=UPI000EF5D070|nr:carboxypeptidase-like regulatory domain-containing protein [Mesonia aquimarina]